MGTLVHVLTFVAFFVVGIPVIVGICDLSHSLFKEDLP